MDWRVTKCSSKREKYSTFRALHRAQKRGLEEVCLRVRPRERLLCVPRLTVEGARTSFFMRDAAPLARSLSYNYGATSLKAKTLTKILLVFFCIAVCVYS